MSKLKVLQPVRFVDAHYDLTPTQQDFIMLVQLETNRQTTEVKTDFKIDLKTYFKNKGTSLEDIRSSHYKTITDDLLNSKISFQYFKGTTMYASYNIFKSCIVSSDLILTVSIVEDVLPLFYINKLKEGHFENNKLVKSLFEKSQPEFDKYVSYSPETYVDFKESSTKRLFQKLLQFKTVGKYNFNFTKEELYILLGYGEYIEKNDPEGQQEIFDIQKYEFIQNKYKGSSGWKDLSKLLKVWLKTISDHKDSEIKVLLQGKNYYKTSGRPIRNISIKVEYDDLKTKLSEEQTISFNNLVKFKLTEKQRYKIAKNFTIAEIKEKINSNIVAKKDNKGNKYFGELKKGNYPKIENVPGYVYSLFFKKTM
jgi:hypothetical protein